ERDPGSTCHRRYRDTLVEVGSEHRTAGHGLLALCLGESGQRRCTGWLLIHDAHCPPHLSRGVRKRIGQRTGRCARCPAEETWRWSLSLRWYDIFCIAGGLTYIYPMTKTLIGYARCSTDKQDLAAQQAMLEELGVAPDRIYMDRGLTGTTRDRPGLDQALAAVRAGDTLVVPKLDRLARSVPDARHIADALVDRGVKLALGASVYDPTDPMGKMFF